MSAQSQPQSKSNLQAEAQAVTRPDAATLADAVPMKSWIAVFGVALGAFMAVLDIQITNSSMADIQGTLGATLDEGSWIATSYLVAEIMVIPLTALFSRVFSTRRYLLATAALFVVFSVACAFSWNLQAMIVFRMAQGFTGGALIPMAMTTMMTQLPKAKQPIGMAIFGLTATFAPSIGPALGGWLTSNFGWKYIFFLNILPGIAMMSAIAYSFPKQKMQLEILRTVDWFSVLAMAVGLGSLEVVLEEGNRKDWFGSPLILNLAIVAAITLTFFLWRQLTAKQPFINLRLLGERNFGVGATANVILGMGMYGSIYVLPMYLTQIQGYDAQQIGSVLMWMGLPQLFIVPFIPKLMQKIDPRIMIAVGLIVFGGSSVMNAFMTADHSGDQLAFAQVVRALGQPLIMIPLSSLAMSRIAPEQAASASALFNMLRNLGGSVGIALISTFLTRREQFHSNIIGQSVTLFDPATQDRLNQMTASFAARGADMWTAHQQAVAMIDRLVRRESFIMAFNDCFFFFGCVLIVAAGTAFILKKSQAGGSAAGAH